MTDLLKSLRTWVEIDLDALDYNFNCVKESLPQNIKMLAEVQAIGERIEGAIEDYG